MNDKGIVSSSHATDFYEHSQRWSQNYTVTEVISIKAQRCISDMILIDPDYPYDVSTKDDWQSSLTVHQVAELVRKYFRADVPQGKSLNEKFNDVVFAFCLNRREIEQIVLTKIRECVDAHVHAYGELTQSEHLALTLILEKKFPVNHKLTAMYKDEKLKSKSVATEKYTVALGRFFQQVNNARLQMAALAEFGDGNTIYANPRDKNPYGNSIVEASQKATPKANLQLTPALPMLPPLMISNAPAVYPACNSCGHATHSLKNCPHLWMTDSNTTHSIPWASSEMGQWWASAGHYVYSETEPLPFLRRIRMNAPGKSDAASNNNTPNQQVAQGGGYKGKQRNPNFQPNTERPFQRRNNYSKGGNPTTTPYERTYEVTVEPDSLCSITTIDSNDSLRILASQLQTPQVETPVEIPREEETINGVSDMAPIISGTRPDLILASVTNPQDLTEYLELTVFQDNKIKQGNAPTVESQHELASRKGIASHALLDTGSMAGDFVSRALVIRLNALTNCYASPTSLNVCSGLDGACYKSDTLIDLGLSFFDDSNIKHTIFITFSVNPYAKLDLIIGRRSLNQHNLFVLTPKRMGFDSSQIQSSIYTGEVDRPYRDGPTNNAVSHTDVDCCRHSDLEESCDSCQRHRFATDVNDVGIEGSSSNHRVPTEEKDGGPSYYGEAGSGTVLPPLGTGIADNSVLLNTASVKPGGIKLSGDEIDDVKTDAFGPFLSALLENPPPIVVDADLISQITFEGDEELQTACKALCYEFHDIFRNEVAEEPADLPPFDIDLDKEKWEQPENHAPLRPMGTEKGKAVFDSVTDMLKTGVVEKSGARFYSQLVVVNKAPGLYRVCVDFRNLNNCTKMRNYPIPDIPGLFDRIGSHRPDTFGVMDLTAGYHQAPLSPECQILTAFICFAGIFQFTRLPFGLKRAPTYFQEMMASIVLAGLIYISCEVYLDDCIVYARGNAEFLKRLREVFERFRLRKLFLKAKKCKFGVKRIEYVGRVISKEGLSMSEAKIKSVLEFPRPKTVTALRGFLGLSNYFRVFVPNHSAIVAPLHKMTTHDSRKQAKVVWTPETTQAFQNIREAISRCPLMHFMDDVSTIHLFTDASDYGVGGALFQGDDDKMKPISFVSKSLTFSQLNWSTIQKEAYGLYICCIKFDRLIRDKRFIIHTDHKNLIYMKSAPSSMVGRWFMALQELDFEIRYVKGKDNVVADAMSRLCPNLQELVIKSPPVDTGTEPYNLPGPYCGALEVVPNMTDDQREAINMCHNRFVGHGGVDRTVNKLLTLPLKWKEMRQHVHMFIQQCACCQKMNAIRVPIHVHKYVTSVYVPFHTLNIDFIGPFPDKSYVLVIICAFTRWTELYWCEDSTAASASDSLLQHFGRFGSPQMIRSGRGSHFANDMIKQFLISTGTPHNLTLAYSKQENAIVERVNKEVNRYLRAFLFDTIDLEKYKLALPFVQRILNSSIHSSTNASPASLLFGNQINLDAGILSPFPQLPDVATPASKVICELYHLQDTLIAQAQTALRTMNEEHLKNSPTEITVFEVNSFVLARYPSQPPTRLHTLWRGPFQVKSIHNSDYTLLDLTTKKFKHLHVSNLKEFKFDPTYTDPADIARRDYMEFFIESIVTHKGNSRRKKDFKFLVKWLNFDESHNTWEPWESLRLTDALHDYLRLHNMEKIIPKE